MTNSWHLDEVIEVLTEKSLIYLVFPGSWVSAKTFLEVSTDTPEHATALVAEWGWEPEQQDGATSAAEGIPTEGMKGPPVLTNDGQAFLFRH